MVSKTGASRRGRGVRGHSGDKAIGGKGHGGVYLLGEGWSKVARSDFHWHMGWLTDVFEEEGERVKNRPGEAGDVIHGEEVTAREDPSACK